MTDHAMRLAFLQSTYSYTQMKEPNANYILVLVQPTPYMQVVLVQYYCLNSLPLSLWNTH